MNLYLKCIFYTTLFIFPVAYTQLYIVLKISTFEVYYIVAPMVASSIMGSFIARIIQLKRDKEALTKKLIASQRKTALTKLTAGVAHHLNTPLGNAITANSHLKSLLEQRVEGENDLAEVNGFVEKSLSKMDAIIQQFRKLSGSIGSHNLIEFNLAKECEFVKQWGLKNHSQLTIHNNIPSSITITTYRDQLIEIVKDLINNAKHHAFKSVQAGSIIVSAEEINDKVIIKVHDNGDGIDDKIVEKIFEPFVSSNLMDHKTGLGLHIIYNIVENKLQGNITFETEKGIGTEFTLHLPKKLVVDE